MWALIKKLLPFIPSLLNLFHSQSTEELRLQRDLAELDALRSKRISPKMLAGYCATIVFFVLALLILIDYTVPTLFPGNPALALEHIADIGVSMLKHILGM